jgi:two-component system, chemotaxis family, response regulator Rcp1
MMVSARNLNPLQILLVEDNPVDVLMTRRALQEGKIYHNLSVVEDGDEAIDFLRRTGKFADAPPPDLILLDLNLPKKSGREVLAEVKEDPDLLHIPVIVLTTSGAEKDIVMSYSLGANCFITKPVDLEQFTGMVKSIEGFWFTVVELPTRDDT